MESERTVASFAYQCCVGLIGGLDNQIVNIASSEERCRLPQSRGYTSCELLIFTILQLVDLVKQTVVQFTATSDYLGIPMRR